MKYKFVFMVILGLAVTGIFPQPLTAATEQQNLNQWLILGPAPIPSFEPITINKNLDLVLAFPHLPVGDLKPALGRKVNWTGSRALTWQNLTNYNFTASEDRIYYLATYLKTQRWLKAKLKITQGNSKISLFLNGNSTSLKVQGKEMRASLDLTNEKHLLLFKILVPKGKEFKFEPTLEIEAPFKSQNIIPSIDNKNRVKPRHILNMINISQIKVSPDGKQAALFLSQTNQEKGKIRRWLEIIKTTGGTTIYSSKNIGGLANFSWLNRTNGFCFTKAEGKKTAIYKFSLRTYKQTCLLKKIDDFSSITWAQDDSFFIYATSKRDSNDQEYKFIREIGDRAAYSGYKTSLFIHYPAKDGGNRGVTHQISDGKQDYYQAIISPNNKKVLLQKSDPDNQNRPYFKNSVYLLDLVTQSTRKLFGGNHFGQIIWSPNSQKLLVLGGPSAFNGLGKTLPEQTIPNDYDTQAYIYDLSLKKATAISKDFNPSINTASWTSSGNIYFTATDKSFVRLFKYSVKKKSFSQIPTEVDVVHRSGFSRLRKVAVFWGSGVTKPPRLYKVNLSTQIITLLKDYNQREFTGVTLGKYENWDFKTDNGITVTGRIYFPVDFDKNKKYPCIVYYYGGTSPVTRDFGGRYPKNWYAANGYIVYVLQPSGTVGFGQEFSAVHVNDWGKVTSQQIIAAVKKFTETHPYVDPSRLGAMGASYGGFLTQFLATKTKIFAAFISHAGISSLSSYWGIGDWGYTYSGIATANSFPWNRKDIYVGHSPLFMADRISTPLLLLHGNIDNNVPPGESYQMFAALKLLGKDVALITYSGQQHWILEYKKRLHWMRTIIAWWDKHLKKQPQHWDHMFKN